MRLIRIEDDGAFTLVEHVGSEIPPYAILSHTWGADQDEVTYNDLINGSGRQKPGNQKLEFCSQQTTKHQLQYFWIDTCCIDKSSSAELTEAINSMFRWYTNAKVCLVYLSDVYSAVDLRELGRSRWFTRGWTLQELIAPSSVHFFTRDGLYIGHKQQMQRFLHEITGIALAAFDPIPNLSVFDVEERMSWVSGRQTKRAEDLAYCLLGIFDVYMPLLYGEGKDNAMARLKREIEQRSLASSGPMQSSSAETPELGADVGSEKQSTSEHGTVKWSWAIFPFPSLAEQLYELTVQHRKRVEDVLQRASERPMTEFQQSIVHTSAFKSWRSYGGALRCCTDGVEDEISAATTAATVAHHSSVSCQEMSLNNPKVLYIDASDKTNFAACTIDSRFEHFWSEEFLIQALWLHANTAESMRSVLEEFDLEQLQQLSYLVDRTKHVGEHALNRMSVRLLRGFDDTVLIAVENSDHSGNAIDEFLAFIETGASIDPSKIRLVIVSKSKLVSDKAMQSPGRGFHVHKHTEFYECLRSLSFEEQDTRRSQITQPIQKTNTWIWQHPSYLSWQSDRSSILWIEGKAGSGKSVLTKSVHQELSSTSDAFICDWYFSTRGGRILMSHASLLRAVLHQILRKDPSTFQYIREQYRCHEPGSSDQWQSLLIMQNILHNIVSAGFEVRVLIDAMDEAESNGNCTNNRRALIAFLRKLVADIDRSSLKIFVSSRPLPDMEIEIWRHQNGLGNIHRIVLQEENYTTISTIIDCGVDALRKTMQSWSDVADSSTIISKRPTPATSRRNRDLKRFQTQQHEREQAMLTRIKEHLFSNANGVILWVISVLNILEATIRKAMYTFAELDAKLKSIPLELSGLYEYYIDDLKQRYDREGLQKARRVLMFVSGANAVKPLRLEELWDAIATPSHVEDAWASELDPIEQERIHVKSWRAFWWTLYDMCGPLVEIVRVEGEGNLRGYANDDIDAKDNVQLSHRTVKDFLASSESAGVLAFSDQEAAIFVQETLRNYAAIVMPPINTPYIRSVWEEEDGEARIVENMAEYLEDKRLLPWILDAMPNDCNKISNMLGVFSARLQRLGNTDICEYRSLQHQTSLSLVEHTVGATSARYAEYVCSNGLTTATRILLKVMALGTDTHTIFAVVDAALLVAIRNQMVDLATRLNKFKVTREPECRFWIEEPYDVMGTLQYLTPFEIAAAQAGNEAIAKMVYDRNHRIGKPMPWSLWPLLSKGRKCWSRTSRDRELYQQYTRKMKHEHQPSDPLLLEDVRLCIKMIHQYTLHWLLAQQESESVR